MVSACFFCAIANQLAEYRYPSGCEIILTKREKAYLNFWHIIFVLYTISWSLGLVGLLKPCVYTATGIVVILAPLQTEPLRVCVTGAAGQIAYSLLCSLANGDVFGKDQVSS